MTLSKISWTKVDDYHATYDCWTLTRYVMGPDEVKFLVWDGRMGRLQMPRMIPRLFNTGAEAAQYVRWIEEGAREYTADRAEIALTSEQRGVL
jgi:hypothetical protein